MGAWGRVGAGVGGSGTSFADAGLLHQDKGASRRAPRPVFATVLPEANTLTFPNAVPLQGNHGVRQMILEVPCSSPLQQLIHSSFMTTVLT